MYDVERALDELAITRRRIDPDAKNLVSQADHLVQHLREDLAGLDLEVAGKALVVSAALVGTQLTAAATLDPRVTGAANTGVGICNVLALAGQRLVVDARAAAAAEERLS